ncbi:hypothetical protein MJP36_14120 [Pseudomonas palleroniana]|nr:hypothetical protein [Pseudomonas palleroniana]UOK40925.1 hypothetical protein MJP36_14120 [Pseudomonas palleroniana]
MKNPASEAGFGNRAQSHHLGEGGNNWVGAMETVSVHGMNLPRKAKKIN